MQFFIKTVLLPCWPHAGCSLRQRQQRFAEKIGRQQRSADVAKK